MMTKKIKTAKNFQFNEVSLGAEVVKLSDDVHGYEWVQLLKIGTFMHPKAPLGKFSLNESMLQRMKKNFDNNVRRLKGRDLAIDYSHDSGGKASGWIKEIELREDDKQLWILADWTPNARQALEEKEFRYISADIDFNYIDNENGFEHGPTLLGAGLTNRPHIKDMEIILSEQGANSMTLEQIKEAIGSLGPEEKKSLMAFFGEGMEKKLEEKETMLEEMSTELSEVKVKLNEVNANIETLKEENKTLKVEKENMDKEAKFSELLNEGKIAPAQKETFMKMELSLSEEFFANAESRINLDEKGTGAPAKEEKEEVSNFEVRLDEEAKKLMSEDNKLTLGEAYSRVLDTNEELKKEYNKTL